MPDKSRKEQLQELLELDPNDSFLHYGLGMEYASEGNDTEAARVLRKLCRATRNMCPAMCRQVGR